MLDEATAAAEAMTLARRVWQGEDSAIFLIDIDLHDHVKAVIHTRAKPLNIEVKEINISEYSFADDFFGAIFAYPNSTGEIKDLSKAIEKVGAKNALSIIDCDLLALTLLKSPGELNADIAIGSAQRFGVPMGFGGPHAGFMAVRTGLERSIPGRLVGQSIDTHGNAAFRLALQTREQHIRRDKATSNICTAQVLLAVISAFYAIWHGPKGLTAIATHISQIANRLRVDLGNNSFKVGDKPVFDTVLIQDVDAPNLVAQFLSKGINIRLVDNKQVSITFDQTTTDSDIAIIYQRETD
jgi:glycine dehydrogenase